MTDEYYCPNCNAILNEQSGFDPDDDSWTCTSCGMNLFGGNATEGERFEGTFWICDKCGATLSAQDGFSDYENYWQCRSCGFVNRISASDILDDGEEWDQSSVPKDAAGFWDLEQESFKSEEAEDDDNWMWNNADDDGSNDCDYSEYAADDTYSSAYREQSSEGSQYLRELTSDMMAYATARARLREEEELAKEHERSEKRRTFLKMHRKAILIAAVVLLLLAASAFAINELGKLRTVGLDAAEAVGMPYEQVVEQFKESGFSDVSTEEVHDLTMDNLLKEGTVKEVSINGQISFTSTSTYSFSSPIIVRYHSAKLVKPPVSSKSASGENYNEIVQRFKKAGFGNVRSEASNDSLIGVINKVDTVKSVTINGDKRYSEDQDFRVDAEVVVYYHSPIFGGSSTD